MRLTLRTMLAYLDGILDAENSEELGKKIESSQFASALVHRIRDCGRRLRLGAPPVEGRGLGRDANTVAEYLDNTLPQDRVPDFEKVCLESDVHLAEVASCHQILALVHSEHREVPNSLRRHIYTLNQPESRGSAGPAAAEPAPAGSGTEATSAAAAAAAGGVSLSREGGSDGKEERSGGVASGQTLPAETNGDSVGLSSGARKLEVPEYLRESEPRRSPLIPVLVTLGVAFILAAVALLAMGPLNKEHPVLGWLAGDAAQTGPDQSGNLATGEDQEGDAGRTGDAEASRGSSSAPAESPEGTGEDAEGAAEPSDGGEQRARTDSAEASGQDAEAVARPGAAGRDSQAEGPETAPPEEEAAGAGRTGAGQPPRIPQSPPGEKPLRNDLGNDDVGEAEDGAPGRDPAGQAPERPGRVPTIPVLPQGPGGLPDPAPDAPPALGDAAGEPGLLPGEPGLPPGDMLDPLLPGPSRPREPGGAGAAPAPPAMDVGRFISETQLLLRFDQDHWARVPANAPLVAGDQLQVLPTYRPQLVLANGIKLTFAGACSMRLGTIEDVDLAEFALLRGRALILTVGRAGARLQLDLAGRQGRLLLNDADSGVAVQLERFLPPGADPRQDPALWAAQIFVVGGTVTWQEDLPDAGPRETPLKPGELAVLLGSEPARVERSGTLPDWIDPRGALSPIDREASVAMEPLVQTGRPVSLALLELTEHRQTEVRALAARCLGYLERYDPLVDQLSDPRQRSYWDEVFHALRDGLTRGPDSAARLEVAFQRRQPNEADILYRLVRGFSPEQLQAGGAEQLVNYLEHPSMAVRVLAHQNLKAITGGVTHLFRPEQNVEEERSKVLRWRQRLREGGIRYDNVPQPFPPRGAAAEPADPEPTDRTLP